MEKRNTNIFEQNKIFLWIALITGVILIVPFLAMQFDWRFPDPGRSVSNEVVWTLSDFIVAGTLFFGSVSLCVLVVRRMMKHRLIISILFALVFFWLWAELAVGVFTNWGS